MRKYFFQPRIFMFISLFMVPLFAQPMYPTAPFPPLRLGLTFMHLRVLRQIQFEKVEPDSLRVTGITAFPQNYRVGAHPGKLYILRSRQENTRTPKDDPRFVGDGALLTASPLIDSADTIDSKVKAWETWTRTTGFPNADFILSSRLIEGGFAAQSPVIGTITFERLDPPNLIVMTDGVTLNYQVSGNPHGVQVLQVTGQQPNGLFALQHAVENRETLGAVTNIQNGQQFLFIVCRDFSVYFEGYEVGKGAMDLEHSADLMKSFAMALTPPDELSEMEQGAKGQIAAGTKKQPKSTKPSKSRKGENSKSLQ